MACQGLFRLEEVAPRGVTSAGNRWKVEPLVKTKTLGIIVAAGLVLFWILFLHFQYKGWVAAEFGLEYLLGFAVTAAVLLVSASLGSAVLGQVPRSTGDLVPRAAVGLALLGMGTLAIAGTGILRPFILWLGLAGCAAFTRSHLGGVIRCLPRIRIPATGIGVRASFLGLAAFGGVTALVACLAPLTANDALVYHLNVPKIYSSHGALVQLPFNVYANMPHYGEMLYTMLFSLAGEAGAKIFYFVILLGTAAAVYVLASRFVETGFAVVSAALFLVQPLVLDPRIVCNVDLMLTYLYLSAVIILVDAGKAARGQSGPVRGTVSAGILGGFMLGIKYTAILPSATLLLVPAFTRSWTWRRILLMTAVAVAVFAPWLIKNQAYVGNPVYPLMEGTFGGANWDETQTRELVSWQRSMGMGRSVLDYVLLPIRISLMGKPGSNYTRFDGTLSPVLLVLVPLACFRRKRTTTMMLLMAAAGLVFWALTSQQIRFLIPAIGLGAVLAGVGLANLRAWAGPRALQALLVILFLVLASSLFVPDQYGRPLLSVVYGDRLPAALGLEDRDEFLGRSVQSYSLFREMNKQLPAGTPVFLAWENRGYYLDRPYFADSFFEASTLMQMVSASGGSSGLRQRIAGMGYRYVVVNELLGDVFSRSYPATSRRSLAEFISGDLSPVHTANRLTLYAIKE
jgi:hypothetical protein